MGGRLVELLLSIRLMLRVVTSNPTESTIAVAYEERRYKQTQSVVPRVTRDRHLGAL